MLPRVLLVGPPDPPREVDPAHSRYLNLAWHAGAAASRFATVRLALARPCVEELDEARQAAEALVPSNPEGIGAAYLSGVEPALQAAILERLPPACPVVLSVSERVRADHLQQLTPCLSRGHDTVVLLTEAAVLKWVPDGSFDDISRGLLRAGARAVLLLMVSGDLLLTFADHRFTIRTGLINVGPPSAATRERIGAAFAAYLATIGHHETPYLRKAALVSMAAALAPRDHALARPDRWRVEHVVRTLEELTAFSPAPLGICVSSHAAPFPPLENRAAGPTIEPSFRHPRSVHIRAAAEDHCPGPSAVPLFAVAGESYGKD